MLKDEFFKNINVVNHAISEHEDFFIFLKNSIPWRDDISSRKTFSLGKAYNYSGISYPDTKIPEEMQFLVNLVSNLNEYSPNNILMNYYPLSNSKMGFHSDCIDILSDNTGVSIFSLGNERTIRFRSIIDETEIIDINLIPGSYFFMNKDVQKFWKHAILPSKDKMNDRISLTLRKLK